MNIFTYDSSAVISYVQTDFGSLDQTPTSIVDNGVASQPSDDLIVENDLIVLSELIVDGSFSTQDNGLIIFTTVANPFGNFSINNISIGESATVIFVAKETPIRLYEKAITATKRTWVGSGSLFEIGGGIERISAPWTSSSGTLRLSGNSTSKISSDYNSNTIIYYARNDYGLVSSIVDFFVDTGNVNNIIEPYSENDYGDVIASDILYSFGGLKLQGASVDTLKPAFAHTGSGTLFTAGGAAEVTLYSPDGIGLFKVSGSAETAFRRDYIASGLLFNIGYSEQSITYDYNSSSIVDYSTLDYEFITSSGSVVNYGSLTSAVDSGETNYGYITNTSYSNIFGLFKFSGASVDTLKPAFAHTGSGTLFTAGGAADILTYSPEGTGLFKVSGSAETPFRRDYIASGLLFNIGYVEESITYDYNQYSGIQEYPLEINYGLINDSIFADLVVVGDFIVNGDYIVDSSIDYGSVTSVLDSGEVDYGYIFNTSQNDPFGLFKFSGASIDSYKPSFTYKGSGSLFAANGAAESIPYSPEGTGLFKVSGSSSELLLRKYTASGLLFNIGYSEQSITYDYNSSSIVDYSTLDYEFITSPGIIDDYGSLTSVLDSGEVDYGYIANTSYSNTFGLFEFSGFSVEVFKPAFAHKGSGTLFAAGGAAEVVLYSPDGIGLFKVSGSAETAFRRDYIASGSLFNIGYVEESITYDYSTSSIVEYSTLDYQFITSSGTSTNYGSVTSVLDLGEVDYGYITNTSQNDPFGLFKFSGASVDTLKPSFTHVGTGTLFTAGGAAESIPYSPEGTGLFKVSGSSSDLLLRKYTASGLLFNIGYIEESITYDYSTSSIVEYSTLDYQFITSSGTSTNYGSVTSVLDSGEVDYGYIFNTFQNDPFGLFKFSGASIDSYKPSFTHVGTGTLFTAGGSAEAIPYSPEGTGLFKVSGSSSELLLRKYTASGSLFNIGYIEESITYDYNTSSIVDYDTLDYESITSPGIIDDYGSVTSVLDSGEVDYGYIFNTFQNDPFGLFKFSGASVDTLKPSFTHKGSGSLFVAGGSAEAIPYSPEGTGLFKVSGSSSDLLLRKYTASGLLFNIGYVEESITYDYNSSSIVDYSTLDYESITSPGIIDDYGSVTSVLDSGEVDYGYITNTSQNDPFGLFKFSGASVDTLKPSFTHKGSGTLFAAGGAAEAIPYSPEGTGLFKVSGSSSDLLLRKYTASGSLFNIGYVEESITYDYNQYSRIEEYPLEINYGLVNDGIFGDLIVIGDFIVTDTYIVDSSIDYGSVTSVLDSGEVDYGYIINTSQTDPFGLFNINGSAKTALKPAFVHVGSGSLFAAGGSAEAIPYSPEGTGLFKVSGSSSELLLRKYTASGSLFNIGYVEESITYDYNTSSIVEYSTLDYEFITSPGIIDDYGSLTSAVDSGEIDYEYIITLDINYAFGVFNLNGSGTTAYNAVFTQIGSGSLFAAGGAAESIPYSPEGTGLFKVSGSSSDLLLRKYTASGSLFNIGYIEESITYDYNTSSIVDYSSLDYEFITSSGSVVNYGSITSTVSDQHQNYGSIANTQTNYSFGTLHLTGFSSILRRHAYDGTGVITLKVQSPTESFTPTTYISSGSFRGFGGSAESVTSNPPENTALYSISGYITEKHTESYRGSGTIFTSDRASAKESVSEGLYSGSGTITLYTFTDKEWLYYRPSPRYVTVSGDMYIDGVSSSRYTNKFIGSGQVNTSGTFSDLKISYGYSGSGRIFGYSGTADSFAASPESETTFTNIFGSAGESFTPATEIGSGSLFAYTGSSEATSVSEIKTGLFVITGTSINLRSSNIAGSGFEYIYGSSTESSQKIFVGSGSLFTSFGLSEATTTNPPEDTQLFTLLGTADESFTKGNTSRTITEFISGNASEDYIRSYNGSGKSDISGTSEEVISSSEVGSGTLFIDTYATLTALISYEGFGTLTTLSGASESAVVNPTGNEITYVVSGFAVEKSSSSYVGSGSVFAINGSSESYSINTIEETILYDISGFANVAFGVGTQIGSGTIFAIGGGAESKTTNPSEDTTLYQISGSATEKHTESYIGNGFTHISGTLSVSFAPAPYQSSGTINIIGQSVDYVVFNPVENTVLFNILGTSTEKFSNADFGSGRISNIIGSAESISVNPPENVPIFTISGASTNSYSRATYESLGNIVVDGSVDEKISNAYEGSEYINSSGEANLRRTNSYEGSGSITVSSHANIYRKIIPLVSAAKINLYGKSKESKLQITDAQTVHINVYGESENIAIRFNPPRIFGTII